MKILLLAVVSLVILLRLHAQAPCPTYSTTLTPLPRTNTTATGGGTFSISPDLTTFSLDTFSYRDLTSSPIEAHIHLSNLPGYPPGLGPVVYPFILAIPSPTTDSLSPQTFNLTATILDALVKEELYAVVHTSRFPAGELRGFLNATCPDSTTAPTTGAPTTAAPTTAAPTTAAPTTAAPTTTAPTEFPTEGPVIPTTSAAPTTTQCVCPTTTAPTPSTPKPTAASCAAVVISGPNNASPGKRFWFRQATVCSGNGKCDGFVCVCNPGFTGTECETRVSGEPTAPPAGPTTIPPGASPSCVAVVISGPNNASPGQRAMKQATVCSGHGKCAGWTCVCDPGFTGIECEIAGTTTVAPPGGTTSPPSSTAFIAGPNNARENAAERIRGTAVCGMLIAAAIAILY